MAMAHHRLPFFQKEPIPADDQFRALEKKVEDFIAQVGKLQDTQAVRDLQFRYVYYLDKCLYDEVVDLFTDDCEAHFIGGILRGTATERRLYCDRFRKTCMKTRRLA
jgi:hypothetical protein